MCAKVSAVLLLALIHVCSPENTLRGPPRVEKVTMLTDSFIPAAMQIFAHLTELMKYDLRPTTQPPYGQTTTSTVRPTPPHRPAIVAPAQPLGPSFYYANQKELPFRDYLDRLKQPSGLNYFDRYSYYVSNTNTPDGDNRANRKIGIEDNHNIAEYFGRTFADLILLANKIEPVVASDNEDEQVQEFSKSFDDSDFRYLLLKQKQIPPTKAYVTLLSLYDLLNKESKRLGLNKYQGYHEGVLKQLAESSQGTSAYQLRFVLSKLREDTKEPNILKKVKQLITDLDEENSYINQALRYIPPLVFAL